MLPLTRILLPLSLVLGLAGGCDTLEPDHDPPPLDRTGFDLEVCDTSGTRLFDQLALETIVDYAALRDTSGSSVDVGTLCANASDVALCTTAYAELQAPADTWLNQPAGGALPPGNFIAFTRGDEIDTVGRNAIGAFLAPIDTRFEAAFIAQVVTAGDVSCQQPSVRAVADGFEVITTRVATCGGEVRELLTEVHVDGSTALSDEVVLDAGIEELCP